jgi:hypothetical protein
MYLIARKRTAKGRNSTVRFGLRIQPVDATRETDGGYKSAAFDARGDIDLSSLERLLVLLKNY